MGIISFSAKPELEKNLEKAKLLFGSKSRSKVIRMAVDSLLRESAELDSMRGVQGVVITVTYSDKPREWNEAMHEHSAIVRMSTHVESRRGCAEILVVEGGAARVRGLLKRVRNFREVKSVSCAVT